MACCLGMEKWLLFVIFNYSSFTYIFIWVRKLDSNSLKKTKNWSGRNEVTETSGRLHPLWPQNKWLHTPGTSDYRHTRQDRWIQSELAFTLAKNATKPNPFEIIPLQTTRKENNWKTKEALVQVAVTLETEWIKGSNPWCLWWWWWWWSASLCFIVWAITCDWTNLRAVFHVISPHVMLNLCLVFTLRCKWCLLLISFMFKQPGWCIYFSTRFMKKYCLKIKN